MHGEGKHTCKIFNISVFANRYPSVHPDDQLTPEEMEYYGLTEDDMKQFEKEVDAYFGRQGIIDVGIYDEHGHLIGIDDDEWGY